MAAFEGLPEELMTLILSKLPVKSLLRFKCVQKSWYSLIKSPHFIHLHRSSSTSSINYDCFIAARYVEKQDQGVYSDKDVISFYSYETLDDLGDEITMPYSACGSVSGSCDGLVCLTDHYDQILICNPSIREFRLLASLFPLGNRSGYHIDSVAFGSDPNTGQYKVVLIGVPYDDDFDEDNYSGDHEARLYDFSTDSWRETAIVIPPGPFHYLRRAISFNGAFHWCPWYDSVHDSILTFHISNEVTGFIPLPDFVFVDFSLDEKELCVSSKSQLSLIVYDLEGRFEVCVMTEYGVKESWTRLFKIGPLLNIFQPIPFWDEQRLFLKTNQGQLVCFDLQHQNIRHFPIDGDFDLYPYTESLVSVNGI